VRPEVGTASGALVKAVLLRETGGPEKLELTDVPEPDPADGEVVLRVRAAGINFLDLLVRQGRYAQQPELPLVPGVEIAGEVDGRRVIALPSEGGYAEFARVRADSLVPLPDGATFEEGAAFLMAFLTAYIPMTRQIRLEPGATVLVHAAAGGVGSAAVLLAKHLGCRVVATASSDEKRAFARGLGADETYGYEDFAEQVRADAVLDPVGGPLVAPSLGVLKPLGAFVALGYAGGLWEDVNPALLVGRNISLTGFYLGRLMRHRPDVVREATEELLRLWGEGAIKPVVGATFPLADAPAAHRSIEERKSVGKVVLVP
jgi:NADPH:quinone reductase